VHEAVRQANEREVTRLIQYVDDRGWTYFVRAGLGENQYKAFYCKPGKRPHAYKNLTWRGTPDQAQTDLNALAYAKGWGTHKKSSPSEGR